MIHRASRGDNLQLQVFGSGGAGPISIDLGNKLTDLIKAADEDKSLSVVAQAIQSALTNIGSSNTAPTTISSNDTRESSGRSTPA